MPWSEALRTDYTASTNWTADLFDSRKGQVQAEFRELVRRTGFSASLASLSASRVPSRFISYSPAETNDS